MNSHSQTLSGQPTLQHNHARYDTAGNLTYDGIHTFTYDAENRLISVVGGMTNSTYSYDADGRRIVKTGDVAECAYNGTTYYLYDIQGHSSVYTNSGTNGCRDEIFAGNRHLATYAPDTSFVQADWLGTERVRRAYATQISQTCTSLPFGDNLACAGAADPSHYSSPLHFTGKEHDSESGLDNFGARYDASSLGRFMTPDPSSVGGDIVDSENPQAWNMYSYVLNNPLNAVDPDGLDYWLIGGDSCGQNGVQCDKQGYVLDNNGNRAVITDQQLNGSKGLAKIDSDGNLQIKTAQGTFQGQFFDPNPGFASAVVTADYSEMLFDAVARGTQMAEPGVKAAAAVTAPQLLFMGGASIALSGPGSTLSLEAGAAESTVAPTAGQVGTVSRHAAQGGRQAVKELLKKTQRNLVEHQTKLAQYRTSGGYTSSVETQIRNFQGIIRACEEWLSRNP